MKKVVMVAGVRVEVGSPSIDDDLAQQPSFGELVERIVNGRQRDLDVPRNGFFVQPFSRHVAVLGLEQQPGERQPLPRRSQFRTTQSIKSLGVWSIVTHAPKYRSRSPLRQRDLQAGHREAGVAALSLR